MNFDWRRFDSLGQIPYFILNSADGQLLNQTWLCKMDVLNLEQVTVVATELVMISVMVSFTARFSMIR